VRRVVLVLAGLVLLVLVYASIYTMRRRTPAHTPVRVIAEAVPAPATISGEVDPLAALDALLAELEATTVRIDGADELDQHAVATLEQLAERLEAAAAALERVA
jgi:hypothetical protein